MKYLIKINRKKPNRSYYLTCDFRTCTYQRRHAYRFGTKEEAQTGIAKLIANGEIKLQDGDTIKMTCNKQIRVIDAKSLVEVGE